MTGRSWHPGCPVSISQLRLVTVRYRGFDGNAHTGGIVVNADVAANVVKVFRRLYDQRYPIRRMSPVDVYGGSDFRSIEADNTSSFNCRERHRLDALVAARLRPRDRRRPDREPVRGAAGRLTSGEPALPRPLAPAPGMAYPGSTVVEAFAVDRMGLGRKLVGQRPRLPALLGERALMARISGALAAAATPLRDGGAAVDEDGFGPLVDFLAAAGLDGLLALGNDRRGDPASPSPSGSA